MNLFITGAKGCGKSTLIKQLMKDKNCKFAGFFTDKKYNQTLGYDQVYIHTVYEEPICYNDHNRVGSCGPDGFQRFPLIFDNYGVSLLDNVPVDSWVLMDELGFMESQSPKFCGRILELLDSPCSILGVIKPDANDFLDHVRQHTKTQLLELTEFNRDQVYKIALALTADSNPL